VGLRTGLEEKEKITFLPFLVALPIAISRLSVVPHLSTAEGNKDFDICNYLNSMLIIHDYQHVRNA
jgi:hypothetical protein